MCLVAKKFIGRIKDEFLQHVAYEVVKVDCQNMYCLYIGCYCHTFADFSKIFFFPLIMRYWIKNG
jgi:hypothetical protein